MMAQSCQSALFWSLFLLISQFASFGWADIGDRRIPEIRLYHAFMPDDWSDRGTISNGGTVQHAVEPHFLDSLMRASQDKGYYYLKAVSSDEEGRSAQTFIKACSLATSSLSDRLEITLDVHGNFLGLSLTTTNPHCDPTAAPSPTRRITSFNSTLKVIQTGIAPGPDTQTYIQRIEQDRIEKLRGDKGENKSFFAKYWIYIIPCLIFLMVSSAGGQEGGGGGGR